VVPDAGYCRFWTLHISTFGLAVYLGRQYPQKLGKSIVSLTAFVTLLVQLSSVALANIIPIPIFAAIKIPVAIPSHIILFADLPALIA